jgi:hypothetical protein
MNPSEVTIKTGGGGNAPITVIEPNGGEVWEIGKDYTVRWSSENLTGDIDIIFVKGDTEVFHTDCITNDGTETLTISSNIFSAGTDWWVAIVSCDDESLYDTSDDYFTITDGGGGGGDASITVIEPNGGEVWQIGNDHTVRWSSENLSGDIDIYFLQGDTELHTGCITNNGTATLTISSDVFYAATDWLVRIVSCNNESVYDTSDNYFTITGGDTDIPQNLIGLTLLLTDNNGSKTQYYFTTNTIGVMTDSLGVSTEIIYAYYVTGDEIQNENEAIISYSYGYGERYDAKIRLTYEDSTYGMYTRTDESPYGLITTTGNFNLYGE